MSGEVQLSVQPLSRRLDELDDLWLDQVGAFAVELRAAADDLSMVGEPRPGTKGLLGSIVVSLASAGSITAMVELAKAWLGRDRTRSLKVSWSAEGEIQSLELSGAGLDDDAFDDLTQALTEQIVGRVGRRHI